MAIPLLAGYLRSNNIEVSAVDANLELHRHLLEKDRIENGRIVAEEELLRLNERRRLAPEEKSRYSHAARALLAAELLNGRRDIPFFAHDGINSEMKANFRMACISAFLLLSGMASYPERITLSKWGTIQRLTDYSEYSTMEIMESVKSDDMLSGFFEGILGPALRHSPPLVVGITVAYADHVLASFRCAAVVKKIDPDAHVVLGGSWVTAHLQDIRESRIFEHVDSIVIGDGERPLERLCKELASPAPALQHIPGLLWYDRRAQKIRKNPASAPMDIESHYLPDYTVLPLDRYPLPRRFLWQYARGSRGCYWRRCAFCPTNRSVISHHQQAGAEYIFNSVRSLHEQTGIGNFGFVEEGSNPEILERFAQRVVDDNLDIRWATNVKLLEDITLERCLLWKKSGCLQLFSGLETYNDRLLRLLQKGISMKTIDRALMNMSWAGLKTYMYMMVGLPTETEKEASRSFRAIMKLQRQDLVNYYTYSAFELLPGSDIFGNPGKYGMTVLPPDSRRDLSTDSDRNFEGAPISRKRAKELKDKFNRRNAMKPWTRGKEIKLNDRIIKLKHACSQ